MIRFDEKFLEELRSKLNIVDVIGGYCNLTRKGGSYWACCPLPGHSERTPSFAVNESGQFYKCFGCGRGGDVITFVMEMESLSFVEAVKLLCERAHMPLPEDDGEVEYKTKRKLADKDRLISLMREAALFYVHTLRSDRAEKHRAYVKKRNLPQSVVTAFGIGASPDYNSLVTYLEKKGFSKEEMLQAGAVQYSKEKDSYYDAVAGRLIFPIIDSFGQVIAFGGRELVTSGFAKYKNTSDTVIFNKRKTLYNVNNLKKEKQQKGKLDYVIMVEGYMDTIALYKAGYKNVVASMGTSLTVDQARMLKRFTDVVLICYDGDSAGQNATVRGLEILKDNALEVRVVSLPDGLDPDEIIAQRGKQAYQECLDNALPLIDFKLKLVRSANDLKTPSGKRKYIESSLKIIGECKDTFLQEELLKKLRDESGITYESLRRDLDRGGSVTVKNEELFVPSKDVGEYPDEKNQILVAERFVLCSYIFNEPFATENLFDIKFTNAFLAELAEYVATKIALGKKVEVDKLKDFVGEEKLAELMLVLAGNEKVDEKVRSQFFADCLNYMRSEEYALKIEKLKAEYAKETDLEKRKNIAVEIASAIKRLAKCKRK